MDWLTLLGLCVGALCVLQGMSGLLLAWCWPGLYQYRLLARLFDHKALGGHRALRTWLALWCISNGLTVMLVISHIYLPGVLMGAAFFVCCYKLRDVLYLRNAE